MVERTEDDGEAGVLHVMMGGRRYSLPVLTIGKSEEWQADLAVTMAGVPVDMDEDADGALALKRILTEGNKSMFAALAAYDIDGALGGEANMRKRMTQRELKAAIDLIMEAEFPFEQGGRSVAEAFGLPLQVLGAATRMATGAASQRGPSRPSPFTNGTSRMPTSDDDGLPSSSSSDGPMLSAVSNGMTSDD